MVNSIAQEKQQRFTCSLEGYMFNWVGSIYHRKDALKNKAVKEK